MDSSKKAISDRFFKHAAAEGRGGWVSNAGSGAAGATGSTLGTSGAAGAEFPLDGANYHELLTLMSEVDSLQTKIFWLDQCCCFHSMGVLSWWQIATMTTGFHPFPPMNLLWVRRLVARSSLMLLLPTLPLLVPNKRPAGAAAAAGEARGVKDKEEALQKTNKTPPNLAAAAVAAPGAVLCCNQEKA
jgi:hypothetical protein